MSCSKKVTATALQDTRHHRLHKPRSFTAGARTIARREHIGKWPFSSVMTFPHSCVRFRSSSVTSCSALLRLRQPPRHAAVVMACSMPLGHGLSPSSTLRVGTMFYRNVTNVTERDQTRREVRAGQSTGVGWTHLHPLMPERRRPHVFGWLGGWTEGVLVVSLSSAGIGRKGLKRQGKSYGSEGWGFDSLWACQVTSALSFPCTSSP